MIVDHTDVSDLLKGKSAGKQMVTAAIAFARKTGIKIIPLYTFAKSVFEKLEKMIDVL